MEVNYLHSSPLQYKMSEFDKLGISGTNCGETCKHHLLMQTSTEHKTNKD